MRNRETQRQRVLRVLREANGRPVPGYVLAQVGGLQFQTRVWELRHIEGYEIECDLKHVNQQVHSTYRLVSPRGQGKLFERSPASVQAEKQHWLEVQPKQL